MSEEVVYYGKNIVIESIKTKNISKVYLSKEGGSKDIANACSKYNIPFVYTEKITLDKITKNQNHQGVVAIGSPVEYLELKTIINNNKEKENPMILMLDEVQDANNLGAILRISDAFSIDGVIFNKRRNIQITSSVAKVSTGAINYVDICRVTNLVNAIKELKKNGYWVAYLDMNGSSLVEEFDYELPLVVVIGGEDKGVTDNIKKHCDFSLKINMSGHVNSLNVASATSIVCHHRAIDINKNGKK